MPSQLQASRSELKFVVNEALAVEIRGFLRTQMQPDLNGGQNGAVGYPVCSVYLDCPIARLYYQTVRGQKNRFKLRVRIYDSDPANPAFLEIKRREGSIIKKKRATVDRVSAVAMLSGREVTIDALSTFDSSSKDLVAMKEFTALRDQIAAVGTTYVQYQREAYVSPQRTDWRATFDRRLKTYPYQIGSELQIHPNAFDTRYVDTVVFELKFTDRFPHWMRELVRTFNLRDVSFPKYVNCHNTLSEQTRDGASPLQPSPLNNGSLV